jgi:hypothetical protein
VETASPPVSPRVVAAILMIRKVRVTSGTLLVVEGIAGGVSWGVEETSGESRTDPSTMVYSG